MRSHIVAVLVGAMVLFGSLGVPLAAGVSAGPAGAESATVHQSISPDRAVSLSTSPTQPMSLSTQSTDDQIRMTTTLDRTPERSGEITATVSFELSSRVTELTTQLPEEATVTETDGFSEATEMEYDWDERTDRPAVTFRVEADRLADREGPLAEEGRYLFADTDEWALVRVPSIGPIRWARTGDENADLEFVRETAVDGPGVAGDQMAFLGPHEIETHTAHGQTFRLVIPEAADLEAPVEEVFGSLSHASDSLRVGDRDAELLVIAAPTGTVDWAVRGLQTGGSEMWVQDSEPLGSPTNVWVHEYVHTRQPYVNRTTAETQWFTEATATYYAALLTLQQNRIDFDEFRRYLQQGEAEPQSTATLSRPESWQNHANYEKGALVVGELDRQIRLATDSEASFETVFQSVNSHQGRLTASDFETYVTDAAGGEVGAESTRYTTTDATPMMWSSQQHGAAFGQHPARFRFELAAENPVRITGPDRSEAVTGTAATLGVGETLTVDMVVENVGGTVGSYRLPLSVANETTAATGRLEPGEMETHQFSHTFAEPGQYTVSVGGERIEVTVEATETESGTPPVDVEVPGFGVIPAVSALLLVGLVAARRLNT